MQPSLQAPSGMVGHAADRLCAAISRVASPTCVGLDPVLEKLPASLKPRDGADASVARAIESFSLQVLDAISGRVGIVKFQSACFERYGFEGVAALERLIRAAAERDLATILDAKRGDIGISASHYAATGSRMGADWMTINGWLGEDGISPFLKEGSGAFVLVRTSNASSQQMQCLQLEDGRTVAEGMADLVTELASDHCGACGYSTLGAVVGATHPAELAGFRERMPGVFMLLPGYGAQGGTAESLSPAFDANGLGAIVTASRSVIYAFKDRDGDWSAHVQSAASEFAEAIGTVSGLRS
ncbi:MAG: orotidine-5'-phosphate decarboxylase [Phycisphaerales bacterium]|nr:orotidine-5'-phosphate decarboxylase [Phycisphaerales bacterium]